MQDIDRFAITWCFFCGRIKSKYFVHDTIQLSSLAHVLGINITREEPLTLHDIDVSERRQRWQNLNAFTARLTRKGI